MQDRSAERQDLTLRNEEIPSRRRKKRRTDGKHITLPYLFLSCIHGIIRRKRTLRVLIRAVVERNSLPQKHHIFSNYHVLQ